MDSPLRKFLTAAVQAGQEPQKSGNGYRMPCLGHNGDDPNLVAGKSEGGRLLLKCHSHDCEYETILAAYGLTPQDVSLGNSKRDRWMPCQSDRERFQCDGYKIAEYRYTDEEGTLLFASCRCSKKGKGCPSPFAQWQPDETKKSGRAWSLKGVRKVPYRLPEVLKAVEDNKTIFITEGEKDADRLVGEGETATTSPCGAGNWEKSFARYFRGARVVIIADRDDAGLKHAWTVADSLDGIAETVEVKRAAVDRKGADVSDHLDSGFTLEELEDAERPQEERELSAEEQFDQLGDELMLGSLDEQRKSEKEEATKEKPLVIVPTPREAPPEPPKDESPEDALTRRLTELRLSEDIWQIPHMAHIAQAADSLHVKREGMAAMVFNRAATLAGPSIKGRIDDRGAFHLGWINALVGRSGAGSNVTRDGVERLLPEPEEWSDQPNSFSSLTEAEYHDFGMETLTPPSGSALVSRMQRQVRVSGDEEGSPTYTGFIPRVNMVYTEGTVLLSSLKKSGSANTQAAGLEPLVLDGLSGSPLRVDVADRDVRKAVPKGCYTLTVDAYFQAEIVGGALERTTGLAQRLRIVPIKEPRGDEIVVAAGAKLVQGLGLTEEERRAAMSRRPVGPEFPGEMPGVVEFLTRKICSRHTEPTIMSMPNEMSVELQLITAALRNGLADDDPLVTHAGMTLYRTAAQSALCRRSYEINMDDWRIAKEFAAISHEARLILLEWAKEHARKEESEETAKASRRARAVENAKAIGRGSVAPIVKLVAGRMRNRLQGGALTATKLRDSVSPDNVKEWTESGGPDGKKGLRNAALVYGVEKGLFRMDGSKYTV